MEWLNHVCERILLVFQRIDYGLISLKTRDVFICCLTEVSYNLLFLARCPRYTTNRILIRQFVNNGISKNVASFLWTLRDPKATPVLRKTQEPDLILRLEAWVLFPPEKPVTQRLCYVTIGWKTVFEVAANINNCTAGFFLSRLVLSILQVFLRLEQNNKQRNILARDRLHNFNPMAYKTLVSTKERKVFDVYHKHN